ncbi:hypothetical protein [Kocuria sabuli]|uniref:hypothetical protein n=1 Tax=Kocuria sabuli TaxID=3071448 RepID=UPI0034D68E21
MVDLFVRSGGICHSGHFGDVVTTPENIRIVQEYCATQPLPAPPAADPQAVVDLFVRSGGVCRSGNGGAVEPTPENLRILQDYCNAQPLPTGSAQ